MKKLELNELTASDLVDLFARIAVAQDEALCGSEIAKFNRLYDRMAAVSKELKSRDGDQRRQLSQLYSYDNMQVRLKAAIHTLAVVPEVARRELEKVANSNWFPQAGDAGMTLRGLNDGTFVPT